MRRSTIAVCLPAGFPPPRGLASARRSLFAAAVLGACAAVTSPSYAADGRPPAFEADGAEIAGCGCSEVGEQRAGGVAIALIAMAITISALRRAKRPPIQNV